MNTHAKDWFAFIALWCLCGLALHGDIEAAAFVSCFTWLVAAYMIGQAAAVFATGWSAQAVTKAQATTSQAVQDAVNRASIDATSKMIDVMVNLEKARNDAGIASPTRNTRPEMTR